MVSVRSYKVNYSTPANNALMLYPNTKIHAWGADFTPDDRFNLLGTIMARKSLEEYKTEIEYYVVDLDAYSKNPLTGIVGPKIRYLIHKDYTVTGMMLDMYGAVSLFTFDSDPADAKLIPRQPKAEIVSEGYENYQLSYFGMKDGQIHISQKEFSPESNSKPSFSHDILYPSTSESFRFKDLLIRVYSASPDRIEFSVSSK